MQRHLFALIVGTTMLGAAALAGCSSGGGSSNAVPSTAGSLLPGQSSATLSGGTLTLTINRAKPAQLPRPKHASASSRRAQDTRKPAYTSYSANGLQVTVSSAGASPSSKSIYADISTASALCTQNVSASTETCSLTVPTLATSETIVATEVDQTPTHNGTNGNPAGYGDGFAATVNILAAGTTTASITGAIAIALGLDPVWEEQYNCVIGNIPAYLQTAAEIDETNGNNRILVTAGFAQTAIFYDCLYDASGEGENGQTYATPLPFADVNASPEPITVTSSTQHVLFQLYIPNESATPAPNFALTASATNESALGGTYYLCIGMQLDGGLTSPATVTLKNNLSAANPFAAANVPSGPITFTVVPISASPLTATLSLSGINTATITGSDYQGMGGMAASGSSTNTTVDVGKCVDGSNTELASVAQSTAISTTTWLQPFTVTAMSTGTCTFYLFDNDGYDSIGTESQAVTVTITP